MSERKWTEGPWLVGEDPERNDTGKLSVHTAEEFFICLVDRSSKDVPNANLIAAAPDLYEALEELRAWIFDPGPEESETEEAALATFEKVDAALAKARGETQ